MVGRELALLRGPQAVFATRTVRPLHQPRRLRVLTRRRASLRGRREKSCCGWSARGECRAPARVTPHRWIL
jgi:hypothetical protein